LVTRAEHAHFVALRCTKWVWSPRETKNLGCYVTLATPFSGTTHKIFSSGC